VNAKFQLGEVASRVGRNLRVSSRGLIIGYDFYLISDMVTMYLVMWCPTATSSHYLIMLYDQIKSEYFSRNRLRLKRAKEHATPHLCLSPEACQGR
jgi:hypothetical protein